ncbi:MAG: pilus assembly protein [Pseudomonadota bacterium]
MFGKFFSNHDGNIAVTSALLIIPLILAAGVAVDYSNIYRNKSRAQSAADSAALAVAREGGQNTQELLQLANNFLDSNFVANQGLEVTATDLQIVTVNNAIQYRVTVAFSQESSFLRVAGIDNFNPEVVSVAGSAGGRLEVAMVLDSTGSMGSNNKIQELKSAVNVFADQFQSAQNVSVAIVPFDTQVRLNNVTFGSPDLDSVSNPYDPATNCNDLSGEEQILCQSFQAACLSGPGGGGDDDDDDDGGALPPICTNQPQTSKDNDTISANSDLLGVAQGDWSGCVIDRAQPFDASSEKTNAVDPASLYPTAHCASGSLRPILPLTKNFTTLRSHVNSLQPSGNTNLTIGVQWGMEVLTEPRPFNETQHMTNDSTVKQVMIVVTDGQNTQNRWSTSSSDIDARSLLACQNAKTLVDEVYTVRIVDGNAALLQQCATSSEHFYDITNANQLDGVFADIAREISSVRLIN